MGTSGLVMGPSGLHINVSGHLWSPGALQLRQIGLLLGPSVVLVGPI